MFGTDLFEFTTVDAALLAGAVLVTFYVARRKNPYARGTDDYQALRLCRISLALLAWSIGFGLIGIAFALTSFILAIIGIVKGMALYGSLLIIGSVASPFISFLLLFVNK